MWPAERPFLALGLQGGPHCTWTGAPRTGCSEGPLVLPRAVSLPSRPLPKTGVVAGAARFLCLLATEPGSGRDCVSCFCTAPSGKDWEWRVVLASQRELTQPSPQEAGGPRDSGASEAARRGPCTGTARPEASPGGGCGAAGWEPARRALCSLTTSAWTALALTSEWLTTFTAFSMFYQTPQNTAGQNHHHLKNTVLK